MELVFRDKSLDRLAVEPTYHGGYDRAIIKGFRRRAQGIRAAVDERDIANMKSWRFERLKGSRRHQHSIRLNDQFRMIVELGTTGGKKIVEVVGIEDYH